MNQSGRHGRRLPAIMLGAAMAVGLLATPGPAAAASEPVIRGELRACSVDLYFLPDLAEFTFTLKRGNPQATLVQVSDTAAGDPTTVSWSCATARLKPGDHLIVDVGLDTTEWVVPAMSAVGDVIGDTITGKVAVGEGSLMVYVSHCLPTIDCVGASAMAKPSIGANGGWSTSTAPAFDLAGADEIYVVWLRPTGDNWYLRVYTPYLVAQAGRAVVTGRATPGKTITVSLRTVSGTVRASGSTVAAAGSGTWSVTLRKNGKTVKVKPGDRVRANLFAGSTLAAFEPGLVLDLDSGIAQATCAPGVPFVATASKPGNPSPPVQAGTADATTGEITADFSGVGSAAGWSVALRCRDAKGLQMLDVAKASRPPQTPDDLPRRARPGDRRPVLHIKMPARIERRPDHDRRQVVVEEDERPELAA